MEKIVLLGTAGAVVDGQRDNVSLVYTSGDHHLLLECGGSAAHKLAKLGIPYEILEDLIITHTHLDHFYGLPGLIFSMRYKDQTRTRPLRIHCPEGAVGDILALLDVFELRDERFFPLEVHGVPFQEDADMFENDHLMVTSTPVDHVPHRPTYGIKLRLKSSGRSVVYSSDTGPSERLSRLAFRADVLFHECAGLSKHPIPEIHSNALQVGEIARKSQVKRLVLLHLDMVANDDPDDILAEVRQNFEGDVVVGADFDEYIV